MTTHDPSHLYAAISMEFYDFSVMNTYSGVKFPSFWSMMKRSCCNICRIIEFLLA